MVIEARLRLVVQWTGCRCHRVLGGSDARGQFFVIQASSFNAQSSAGSHVQYPMSQVKDAAASTSPRRDGYVARLGRRTCKATEYGVQARRYTHVVRPCQQGKPAGARLGNPQQCKVGIAAGDVTRGSGGCDAGDGAGRGAIEGSAGGYEVLGAQKMQNALMRESMDEDGGGGRR